MAYRIKVLGTGITHIHTYILLTSPSFLQIPQGNLYVTSATWRPWVKAIEFWRRRVHIEMEADVKPGGDKTPHELNQTNRIKTGFANPFSYTTTRWNLF